MSMRLYRFPHARTALRFAVLLLAVLVFGLSASASPAAAYTVTPHTWNVIGLDSNTPGSGPNRFPVGARVCGGTNGTSTTAGFSWVAGGTNPDDGTYLDLRPGSANPVTITFGADGCADAYFEVEVTANAGAFDKTRRYAITVGADSSPRPREVYVEHLVSQGRNYINDVRLNGVSIPAGGTMNLMVGHTYTIELHGGTATQGYNQFEEFINFPNTIFQVQSVSTNYSANNSPYVATTGHQSLYADACGWESDSNSPYYLSCVGGDYKSGGSTVVTTYTVKIVGGAGGTQTLNTLLYDFSGSSFHYNSDYSTGSRIANILGPDSVTIRKRFTPSTITPNGLSTLTFSVTNPASETLTGVSFSDPFPAGLAVASIPALATSGCGTTVTATGGDTALSLVNGSIAAGGTCTISVNVTAPQGGYTNTSGHLYIDSNTDTGNYAVAALTASPAPSCIGGQTLASWTVPVGATSPPDAAGGSPTVNNTGYAAAASAQTPASTSIATGGYNDNADWATYGYKTGNYVQYAVDTRLYSSVTLSFWLLNASPSNGPTSMTVTYDDGSGFQAHPTAIVPPATTSWTAYTIDLDGRTNPSGTTIVRIAAAGAKNDNSGAGMNYDVVTFTGCRAAPPAPAVSMAFSPATIARGLSTSLTFTITNTSANSASLTGVGLTDTLPTGLSVADSSTAACGGGTLTTTAGTGAIALSSGTLAAGGSCSFSVPVTGTTEGQYQNITGNVTAAESGPNTTATGYATAALTVIAPPALTLAFAPASIYTSAPSNTTLASFILTNPNTATALSGIGFASTLPAGGLTVLSSGPTATCGGTLTTASPDGISFTAGTLAADGTCTLSLLLTAGTATGTITATTSAVTSSEGGTGNAASASLVASSRQASIDLSKQIATSSGGPWTNYVAVAAGSDVYYRFKVYNSGEVDLSNIGITETTGTINPVCAWPSPLAPGDTAYCVSGAVTALAGTQVNAAYAHGEYPSGATVYSSATSTATYATTGLSLTTSALQTQFTGTGNVIDYTYAVRNTGAATLAGPVTIADNKTTATCPALSTVGDLDDYLDSGETVTCTATYTIQAADVTAKLVTNIATASTTLYGGMPAVTSASSSATVLLAPDLTATKTNNVGGKVQAGNAFTWTITVTNLASAGTATFTNQVLLTDDLPASGAVYSAPTVTTTSGTTGTITCSIASNTLTCSASGSVTIPPGDSFGALVSVATATTPATLANPKSGGVCRADPGTLLTEIDETNNDCADTVEASNLPNLLVVKSATVLSDPINGVSASAKPIPGAVVQYTIQVFNNGGGTADAGSIVLTDVLPSNLSMFVDDAGSAVTFSCSGCGLTTPWTYANAVSFSYQATGGDPYVFPPVTNGYDPLVRGVRIQPAGTLNSGGASFTVQFQARIE